MQISKNLDMMETFCKTNRNQHKSDPETITFNFEAKKTKQKVKNCSVLSGTKILTLYLTKCQSHYICQDMLIVFQISN